MSDEEAQPQANFTGFDAGPQQRLARVAAVGGGSATDKHRENRQHAQNLQASGQVKSSGIVDTSNTSGAGFGTEAADLGAFGAHGRKPAKQRTGGAPPPSVLPSQPVQQQSGSNVVQLNPREAEEMERRMRADLDRATKNQQQQQQEDVFEAEYAAIQANQQQPAAPAQAQGAVSQVADDDFDF